MNYWPNYINLDTPYKGNEDFWNRHKWCCNGQCGQKGPHCEYGRNDYYSHCWIGSYSWNVVEAKCNLRRSDIQVDSDSDLYYQQYCVGLWPSMLHCNKLNDYPI